MAYIQPENSNRVNSIKQKFESSTDANITTDQKCFNEKTKESLCRTLSASPIAPRKNLKLLVSRQLSNPGRNIKRSPAFRGDKLARTRNLNSPTKEKSVSLVDKNVKLFEDKPEYGKLGNVKKKSSESTDVYDDVDSIIGSNNCGKGNTGAKDELRDGEGYGKILTAGNSEPQDSRSRSLDRLNNKQTPVTKVNGRKDSVRTTVISRHKNISSISGGNDDSNLNEFINTEENTPFKLDKFLKNGVEYTKVMKTKSSKRLDGLKTDKQISGNNSDDEKDALPDIREELSRRIHEPCGEDQLFLTADESEEIRRASDATEDFNPDVVSMKDVALADEAENLSKGASASNKPRESFRNKLTDTLKAALKAPLPSGPPPKKPPRTFAHSPTTNRSPVDEYEEKDGFWQKKKLHADDTGCVNSTLDLPDARKEKIHSFLHDLGCKQFRKSLRDRCKEIGNNDSEKVANLDSHLHRIKERNKSSSNFKKDIENSSECESITIGTSNNSNLSVSLAKLGIDSKQVLDTEEDVLPQVDLTTGARESLSPTNPINETASSEDNSSASPLNISYSPQKFKTSPARSCGSGRSRTSKDSKEMLEKLEHVLIQHQKACGPKVIIPRTDKFDLGIVAEDEIDAKSNISRHKEIFQKRLSRTLEEARKLGPLPNLPDQPERSRNLAFDCLPSLNCAASSSIYEQIQNPDFKTYLTDIKDSSSLERSENIYSKSCGAFPGNSQFYLDKNTENSPGFINPDPYDMLVISPASKRLSTELTTFSDAKKQTTNASKKEEHVYAEPFAFNTSFSTDVTRLESGTSSPRNERKFRSNKRENSTKSFQKGAELHYMCTPIPTAYVETNNNDIENELTITKNRQESEGPKQSLAKLAIMARRSPHKFDKTKIEQLLDQAFGQPVMAGSETPTDSNTSSDTDSLASTTSVSEEYSTFNEKLQIFKEKEKLFRPSKAELHRTQTDKRKHYVRRVSSKYTDRKESLGLHRLGNLFEVCLLVELNLSTRKPYVKDQYPVDAPTPAWIENFCFPDGLDWPPMESDQNLAYTFVLTDEKGGRRYGYCRRVKPEGAPVCLPLAYCLITKHRASGFYAKLLDHLESRHGQPDVTMRNFIEQLYNSTMPKPGESLRLKPHRNESANSSINDVDSSSSINNNLIVNKPGNRFRKPYNNTPIQKSIGAFISSEKAKATEDLSDGMKDLEFNDDEYTIVRMDDHRLEEKDMSQLFDAVSHKVLMVLFASLLLERKVVLTCNKLSKLSSCVEALQSLLYPLSWPHPFIPFLPNIPEFSEILQAPSPFVIGILKQRNGTSIQISALEDGIVVDLDSSKVIKAVGDESSILPSRLQKGLKSALQLVSNSTKSQDGFRNFLVSEAFLRVFVETCAHCDSHIITQRDGKISFDKESFVKAGPSRGVQYFLEWFVETTMFNQFIHDRILRVGLNLPCVDQMKLFDQRLAEYLKAADKNSQTKKGYNKKKTLGDRFKDLTNFNN